MISHSVSDLGNGRFKIRWREWVEEGGVRRRVERSLTVSGKQTSAQLHAKVVRALETVGYYEPEARVVDRVGNLEQAAFRWLRHKAARGCTESTTSAYGTALKRFFAEVRRRERIADDRVVPTTVLSRDLFADVALELRRAGLSESTIYTTIRIGYDVWVWASDEPETYPGLPTAPRDPSRVLPRPPVYGAPPAPTLAEVDACIRHLPPRMAYVARPAAIIMRYTGLRVGQVFDLTCGDVNLARAELRVSTGKSRREKAEQRTIPISRHLVEELRARVSSQPPTAQLVQRRKDQHAEGGKNHLPGMALTKGWERATQAGETRREVWQPANRKIARPDHAFRAAFQAYLESVAVRDSVIDFLVGHAPASVRGKHYAPPTPEATRAAVERIPAIDWTGGEEEVPDNVVVLRPR